MKVKYFRRAELDKALYGEGIVGSISYAYKWIILKEKAGRLRIQRDSNGDRRLTEKQIKEIVDAFKIGGRGFWSYEEGGKK
jgi:hypothetical protein